MKIIKFMKVSLSFLFVFIAIYGVQIVGAENKEKTFIQRGNTRIELPPAGYTKTAYVKVLINERSVGLIRVGAAARTDGEWQDQKAEYTVISKPEFESIIGKVTYVKGPITVIIVQETTVKQDGSISVRMTANCDTNFKIVEVGIPFAITDPECWDKSIASLWDKDNKIAEVMFPPTKGSGGTLLNTKGTLIKIKHPEYGEVSMTSQNQVELFCIDARAKSWILGYSLLADANNVLLLAKEEKELFKIEIKINPPKTGFLAINIVANGSFETITNTATSDAPGVPDGFSTFYSLPGAWQKGILPGAFFGADETTAVHGKKSLKISFPKGIDAKGFNIISVFIRATPEITYTFSASLKADKEKFPVSFGYPGLNQTVKISTEWERYTFTFKTSGGEINSPIEISFKDLEAIKSGATIWIDAVQLEIGDIANLYTEGKIPRFASDISTLSVLKNSKEVFFPLGLYVVTESALEDIKKAGFNSVIAYEGFYNPYGESFNKEKLKSYLDTAQKNEISVMLGLGRNYYAGFGKLREEPNLVNIEAMVTTFKSHPALFGYYIADEPSGEVFMNAVNKVNSLIKKIDPDKSTMLVLCNMSEVIRFRNSMDVLGVDPYPVPKNPLSMVADWMDTACYSIENKKPVWLVAQAFGGQEQWFREPSPAEARCMAYLGVVHGAKGIFWFIYKPTYTPLWDELAKINKEITELAPVLLANGTSVMGRLPGASFIHYWSREFADKIVIIAVNESSKPIDAVFSVSGEITSAEEMFEKRELTIKNNVFSDKFAGFGTHVYSIKK